MALDDRIPRVFVEGEVSTRECISETLLDLEDVKSEALLELADGVGTEGRRSETQLRLSGLYGLEEVRRRVGWPEGECPGGPPQTAQSAAAEEEQVGRLEVPVGDGDRG